MSVGLIGLLDDVAGIAKVAAASVDDVAGMAMKAGFKASGAVIDDAAVTPKYLTGFSADCELPIVAKIATGSIKNKLIFLLPAALILSALLPWAITPLLMLGGAYLCYEGVEKIWHLVAPQAAHDHEAGLEPASINAATLEDAKVGSAIKTDFILSAEIMAIALAELPGESFVTQAIVLLLVAIGITAAVYGSVALIVKADDVGLWMARDGRGTGPTRVIGRAIVVGMPYFLVGLTMVGTAAMIWVGGSILVHGAHDFGLHLIGDLIHDAAVASGTAYVGVVGWFVETLCYAIAGILAGAAAIPVVGWVISPLWSAIKRALPGARAFRA
jgi:predicted DNA repair protein MutK